ncbi:MAG: class I SAM-dependent methyltransferase [Gaiellaceae bacterium]
MGFGQRPVEGVVSAHACRLCGTPLSHTFADLGSSPLANSYLEPEDLDRGETFLPLHAYVCEVCFLVQLPAVATPEAIFGDYAYFSSYSDSWLEHARRYVEAAVDRFALGSGSRVVEVASNDGYLLQYFQPFDVQVLGVEPARNVAAVARERGIPTVSEFMGRDLGRRLAEEHGAADLVVGNNVLAHVPDLHDFVGGLRALLADAGVLTMEFPHLLRLVQERQFDTIYHEHYSYLSLVSVERLFGEHDLVLFDVEELPTHGGSLRVFASPSVAGRGRGERVVALREREEEVGLTQLETYRAFGESVRAVKRELLKFLIDAADQGASVVGYGAAAKGNTLLNYCGVRSDLVAYVVDRSPYKQGRFLPGTRIPIHDPERVRETRPDYVLILPWNLREEIAEQLSWIREWGGRFVVPIPSVAVLA